MKTIYEIEKLMGLKKVETPYFTGGFFYEGTLATGDFKGVGDYDRGLLSVRIGQHIKFPLTKICISTIDDGTWQGSSNTIFTAEQIDTLIKNFIEEYRFKLPSEEKLNEFLSKYGIYGLNTG